MTKDKKKILVETCFSHLFSNIGNTVVIQFSEDSLWKEFGLRREK